MERAGTGVQEPRPLYEEQRHASNVLRWLVWGSAFLAVYVLSVGPAARVYKHLQRSGQHPRTERGLEVFYSPLGFLARRCPPADRFLSWYLSDVWHIDLVE
jgi:hypothetical protein